MDFLNRCPIANHPGNLVVLPVRVASARMMGSPLVERALTSHTMQSAGLGVRFRVSGSGPTKGGLERSKTSGIK
eukprot:350942-Chlamydomonas_euryale.AAC.2